MLEDLGIDEDSNEDHDIPISNEEVTGEVFKKALAWMEKNRGKLCRIKNRHIVDRIFGKIHPCLDRPASGLGTSRQKWGLITISM